MRRIRPNPFVGSLTFEVVVVEVEWNGYEATEYVAWPTFLLTNHNKDIESVRAGTMPRKET